MTAAAVTTAAEALEIEALDAAARHDFDTAALRFQRDRWSNGSLANTFRASRQLQVYRRALQIACERAA